MTREQIIAAIDEEIGRLQQVRSLLQSASSRNLTSAAAGKAPAKRILSAEARQRIAAAQKRRWAKQKKEAASSSAKK